MKRSITRIINDAKRIGRIGDGLVLCENCDTPADKGLSTNLSWTACAPCVWGEAASFDPDNLITVERAK